MFEKHSGTGRRFVGLTLGDFSKLSQATTSLSSSVEEKHLPVGTNGTWTSMHQDRARSDFPLKVLV
jgi:hypothetical protein